MDVIAWLNELYELSQVEQVEGLPWDGVPSIRIVYNDVKEYVAHHYIMTLTENGWVCTPKPNWREKCIECNSIFVIDGTKCACCADGL